VHSDGA